MDLEILFICAILRDQSLGKILFLDPKELKDPIYRIVYELSKTQALNYDILINDLQQRNLLSDKVQKKIAHLFTNLPLAITIEELKTLEQKIHEEYLKNLLEKDLSVQASNLKNPNYKLSDALSALSSLTTGVHSTLTNNKRPDSISILDRKQNDVVGKRFNSGLGLIDKGTRGMQHGHIWLISGAYKSFKSRTAYNIIRNVLDDGNSVCYISSEDTDTNHLCALMSIKSGLPIWLFENRKTYPDYKYKMIDLDDPKTQMNIKEMMMPAKEVEKTVKETEDWARKVKLRIYDTLQHSNDIDRIVGLITMDQLVYQTDLVVLDYVQGFVNGDHSYEGASYVADQLLRLASNGKSCVLEISQMNNEAIRAVGEGITNDRYMSTKNSGDFPMHAHVGLELLQDWNACDGKGIYELGIWMKIARRSMPIKQFIIVDPPSGKFIGKWRDEPVFYGRDYETKKPKK